MGIKPSGGMPMIRIDRSPRVCRSHIVSFFRRLDSARTARAQALAAPARGTLKRRIVLHVLRAPHGEIAVAVDETRGCAHRRTR
jgi:hypothetical protein